MSLANLASAIGFVLREDACAGETYVVADPAPVTIGEIVTALRRGRGKPPGLVAVPEALLRLALTAAGRGANWEQISGGARRRPGEAHGRRLAAGAGHDEGAGGDDVTRHLACSPDERSDIRERRLWSPQCVDPHVAALMSALIAAHHASARTTATCEIIHCVYQRIIHGIGMIRMLSSATTRFATGWRARSR